LLILLGKCVQGIAFHIDETDEAIKSRAKTGTIISDRVEPKVVSQRGSSWTLPAFTSARVATAEPQRPWAIGKRGKAGGVLPVEASMPISVGVTS
jgi:hypothetical protein